MKFALQMGGWAVLGRLLSPQDFGLVAMITAFTRFLDMFKDLGLSMATVQRSEITHEQVSTLFWVNAALGTMGMVLTVVAAPALSVFYKEPRLITLTMVVSVGFLISGLTIQHQALMRRRMRFHMLALLDVGALAVGVVTAILTAIWSEAGPWALIWMQLGSATFMLAGVWFACGWRPGPPVRRSGVRSMLAFGGNLTGYGIINYFSRNLDKILIGRAWGDTQLGYYENAYKLLLFPISQIHAPVQAVAVPALSRVTDDPKAYRRAYLGVIEKMCLLIMPGVAFMVASSDWLVRVILGPQWDETAYLFSILGFVALIQPITSTSSWLFITQDRTRDFLYCGIWGSLVIIVPIVLLAPYGARAVAVGYAISAMLVQSPLIVWLAGRKGPVRVRDFYATIIPYLLISFITLAAMLAVRRVLPPLAALPGCVVLFLLTAAVTLGIYLVFPRTRRALVESRRMLVDVLRGTFRSRRQVSEDSKPT